MKAILTCLLIVASHAHALTAEEIRKIAAKPHSRENLVEALKIYPEARKYKITQKSGPAANKLEELPEVTATEKTVEGKYLVTLPDLDDAMKFIMVVEYDPEMDVLRKWVLLPDGKVVLAFGVADAQNRTIAWVSSAPGNVQVLSHETHDEKQSVWREVFMNEGKIVAITLGLAVKIE